MNVETRDYMSLNYLIREITDREVPLSDSIIEHLHPDRDRAREIFVRQVKIAVKEFCRHYPLVMSKYVSSTPYTFIDNSEGYYLGNVAKSNVELVPQMIANVAATELSRSVTRNNYFYDASTGVYKYSVGLVTYFALYPIYYELSENEDFTDESGIYFIGQDTSRAEKLIDQISYTILSFLQSTRKTVSPAFGMQFFDFNERLIELKDQLLKNYRHASTLYNVWAKTGLS